MIVLELNRVEIDYCQKCKGIWLDSGEISTLETISASDEGAARKLGRVYGQLEKAGYQTL